MRKGLFTLLQKQTFYRQEEPRVGTHQLLIMPDANLEKLTLKNLVAAARGAVDSRLFQHIYVRDGQGNELDVAKDGELSCAYALSGLLTLFGLIDRPHATVATTIEKMKAYGWQEEAQAKLGAVIYWPEYNGNEHIGLIVGENECVSNSSKNRTPVLHGFTLSSGVQPTAFYIHPTLKQ